MKILVTGVAGFIGMHVARRLLEQKHEVVGIDNLSDYYDVQLKKDRLKNLIPSKDFRFIKLDISDPAGMGSLFDKENFQKVVNLAAQPGVRYSLKNPHAYLSSNIVGFLNILEGCRHHRVEHLVYASSSSVYGANTHRNLKIAQAYLQNPFPGLMCVAAARETKVDLGAAIHPYHVYVAHYTSDDLRR